MNLNGKQLIAISIAILGVLMVSTSQLTDLFGPTVTKSITAVAALLNSVLGATMAVLTSQGANVRDVLDMPGVEKINVNRHANQTLAQIAVDPAENKISATPQAQSAVEATARGDTSDA